MCTSGPPDKYVKFAHYEEVLLLYLQGYFNDEKGGAILDFYP